MQKIVSPGDTNISGVILILDSTTGQPETGVNASTPGLSLWYRREGALQVAISPSDLSALTDAHTDGGLLHIGDGYYRLDIPDAAFATGADSVLIGGSATGMVVSAANIQLNAADAVWDEVLTAATHNVPTSAGRRLRAIGSLVIREDTAQGPGGNDNQIVLDAGASAVDGTYDPSVVVIVGGTGVGQMRLILQYEGATKTATVDRNWKVKPDDTSEFQIVANPGREHVNEGLARAGTANTITLNTLASSADEAYTGQVIFIRSGTGEDQACRVIAYDGTTQIATICRNWAVIPDTTSAYVMLPTAAFYPPYLTGLMWDALIASYQESGSFGELMQLLALSSEVSIFTSLVEAVKITADVAVSTLGNIDSMIPGTTREFTITIKKSGVIQDISEDTVTYRIKDRISDSDADALLSKAADVATRGAQGVAAFALTPTDTALAPTGNSEYHHDIEWVTGTDVYVIYSSDLTVSERVSDA